jgi:hypothetical protein
MFNSYRLVKRKCFFLNKSKFYFFSLSRDSLIHLEDLSNGFLYEIFDFLGFYEVYKIFSKLNTRFKNLKDVEINFSA